MDYEAIEARLSEIEEIIGIDDFGKKRSIPAEIEELVKKLKDDNKANLLMSVPIEKLQSLNRIATETSNLSGEGSLKEKIESVKFSEGLINQRVELLKQFENGLENVLDIGCLSKLAEMQPDIDEEIRVCESLLEEWRKERAEFLKFRQECSTIVQRISERVLDLQKKVDQKTD